MLSRRSPFSRPVNSSDALLVPPSWTSPLPDPTGWITQDLLQGPTKGKLTANTREEPMRIMERTGLPGTQDS